MVRHVLWIGGPPGSGKTAVATRIARRHGLRLYSADTRTWEHRDRAVRQGVAAAIRWEAMTPEERWERSTAAEMLEQSLHRERGPMVVDDMRALPRSPLVVAEGSTLPALAVQDRSRAAWLMPTAEFRRARLAERGLPDGARELYELLTDVIERDARESDMPLFVVDGIRGIDATVADLERHFAASLAEGPLAEAVAERRALLREANEAVVAQVRGYYARPWADGDPGGVVRTFLCECGDQFCEVSLDVRVDVAGNAPVLAAGHS